MPATGVSGVDLYAKTKDGRWRFVGNGRPMGVSNTAVFTLPSAPPAEQFMLYLPLYNGTRSIEVGIPKNCTISKPDLSAQQRPKPIVFYGTSIVQGACASRPGMASVAIAGRQLLGHVKRSDGTINDANDFPLDAREPPANAPARADPHLRNSPGGNSPGGNRLSPLPLGEG